MHLHVYIFICTLLVTVVLFHNNNNNNTMAREHFVRVAPALKERKAAPTAIQEEKVSV